MKTFAVIENGIVTNIIVGVEPEVVAANPTKFVEYTAFKPAGIGWTHDGTRATPPKPYPSWVTDNNYGWKAPTPKPVGNYGWNEALLSWKLV